MVCETNAYTRIVIDRDTGKPKGYGFCEFYDRATAESAYRNLNGTEVAGRALRIDFAEGPTRSTARGTPRWPTASL